MNRHAHCRCAVRPAGPAPVAVADRFARLLHDPANLDVLEQLEQLSDLFPDEQ